MYIDNIIVNELEKEFKFIRDLEIILKVDFPILFTFKSSDKYYLGYVIKFKRRKKIYDIYFQEINLSDIILLLEQKISLGDYLNPTTKRYLRIDSSNAVDGPLENLLPPKDFYITPVLPNFYQIEDLKEKYINKVDFEKRFVLTETKITVQIIADNIQNKIELRNFKNLELNSKRKLNEKNSFQTINHLRRPFFATYSDESDLEKDFKLINVNGGQL